MSYAGIEYGDSHEHHHCGDTKPHKQHQIHTGGHNYYICTGQLTCEHNDRYDGLS